MVTERGERGAALLTVLLLVAIIAVMATTALEKLRLATRLAGNVASGAQARDYAQAAETLALVRVGDLLAKSSDRVSLAGGWSDRPFGLPLPGGGTAIARVTDGGNCFNLNSLVTEAGTGLYLDAAPERERFGRLMRLIGIPGQSADAIGAAASDWIDTDATPLPGGAEDETYRGRQPAYRAANTLFTDVSELRAVAGVTPELYATLRPWVCALPNVQPGVINVDTLTPEQAALLAMLLPDTLSVDGARAALLQRPPEGYGSVDSFWRAPALSSITAAPDAVAHTSVRSQWFALRIDVEQGGASLEEHALIDATRLPPRLVSRSWGEPS